MRGDTARRCPDDGDEALQLRWAAHCHARGQGPFTYLHADHLGSTLAATDSNGTVLGGNQPRYYAFGTERRPSIASLPTSFTYTGQRSDVGTGLMYYGARYYNSRLGTFVQPDTMVPQPSNPQSLNRYAYGLGNPVKYRDPTGHWVETAWDVLNIGWDIYEVKHDPSSPNIGALVVDVGAAVLPFVPAGVGLIARGGKAAKLGITAVSHADDVADVGKAGAKIIEEASQEIAERAGQAAAGQGLKLFTARNFRENLQRLTGRSTEMIQGLEAHHVLPQEFSDRFARSNIDINDPRFGSWVDATMHRGWSYGYNREWEQFFSNFAERIPSQQECLDFARHLAEKYGFDVDFTTP